MEGADLSEHDTSYLEAIARRDAALFTAHQQLEVQADDIRKLDTELAVRLNEVVHLTRMLETSGKVAQQQMKVQSDKIKDLEVKLTTQSNDIAQQTKTLKQRNREVQILQAKLDALVNSTTWRVLEPVRKAVSMIRRR